MPPCPTITPASPPLSSISTTTPQNHHHLLTPVLLLIIYSLAAVALAQLFIFIHRPRPVFSELDEGHDVHFPEDEMVGENGSEEKKVRKKRVKKKKKPKRVERFEDDGVKEGLGFDLNEVEFVYPVATCSSLTQRRIKQRFDQLMKQHESKELTFAQITEFVNCLIEVKKGLEHKSEALFRKFTLRRAFLSKVGKSSGDRLRQELQINKLETELKRLKEDLNVYDLLQQQLKLSPLYKKVMEMSESMELDAKPEKVKEIEDNNIADISFEDFLAQEKKDVFWQKYQSSRVHPS